MKKILFETKLNELLCFKHYTVRSFSSGVKMHLRSGDRGLFSSRESLTKSRDTLGCPNWGEGDTTLIYLVEARDGEILCNVPRPPTKTY